MKRAKKVAAQTAAPRRIRRPSGDALYFVQYLAARACPICGRPLHYFAEDAEHGISWRIELACAVCADLPPVDAFLLPAFGDTDDELQENLNEDMQQLAEVVLKVKSGACGRVQGIRLTPPAKQ